MIDDIKFLDDSTRPAPARFDNLTIAQRAPGRHLAMIHNHFRQNMEMLRDMIRQAAAGEVTPEELQKQAEAMPMWQNYRQFGALCGQHCQIINTHHSIEDQSIFPLLRERSDVMRKIVDRLEAEHVIVHELLVRLVAALNDLVRTPGPSAFAAAKELYETLDRILLSHFGYEEESIGDALGVYEVMV